MDTVTEAQVILPKSLNTGGHDTVESAPTLMHGSFAQKPSVDERRRSRRRQQPPCPKNSRAPLSTSPPQRVSNPLMATTRMRSLRTSLEARLVLQ